MIDPRRRKALETGILCTTEAIDHGEKTKATARKSYGKYKPVLKHPLAWGWRTEVVGRARNANRTYERGNVYDTKAEAIAYADKIRLMRIEMNATKLAEYMKELEDG
jgi:hypothetical protein